MTLTEPEKAYLAGLIDADGCIYISSNQRPPPHATLTHGLSLVVAQVNEPFLQHWRLRTGCGSITDVMKPEQLPTNYSRRWQWRVAGMEAEKLLRAIQPYLVLKKEEAVIALEFRATYGRHYGRNPTPAYIVRQRIGHRNKLRAAKVTRKGQSLEDSRDQPTTITCAQRPQQLTFTLA